MASCGTRNPETAATLRLLLDEIEKMQRFGPTATELEAAKRKLI